ncbi:prepilin-type N-terminal cleavage/methylation domain-containing protein [Dethiosulfatibacter aminovorans DSM 17477]|uniref:Prepilin-type N-terminal cleavage/methylation domain-containing protein n=1 Tax=Dethiosulfatibacter aminovorans DSM 17477 TaxID=1121476 RepID=A0A1M6D816_9FIRM|nr:type II secretion system protein [Dethiosulfatibacter aminovorans]SHI69138.1 prepilin-type N-terminal cleavage/methylation domain-containing protein [Dethiosulfatibacter aminovorans DSM 17477]
MKIKFKNGFTLIELIIVLAVLSIIALIAIPRYLSVQDKSKKEADYGNAASIAKAAEVYFVQEEEPSINPTIGDLTGKYLNDEWIGWQHPDNKGKDVYIVIRLDTGGTVGVYAGNSSSGTILYPNP